MFGSYIFGQKSKSLKSSLTKHSNVLFMCFFCIQCVYLLKMSSQFWILRCRDVSRKKFDMNVQTILGHSQNGGLGWMV